MKYVLIESHNTIYPIMFAEHISHDSIVPTVSSMNGERKIVSAGFINFSSKDEPMCHGKSESLKIKSRPKKDSEFMLKYLAYGEAALILISMDYIENPSEE